MNEWLVGLTLLALMVVLVTTWCITEQLCKYGMNCWHRWGKWTERGSYHAGIGHGQERFCEKCNMKEIR